jgi:activator of 2-hydroxyglutaryl-CoA dehydratase
MCTVFVESEVTSLIAKGCNRREIARGLHASVVRRAAGMINRVSSEGNIVFTVGVIKNPCMVKLLSEKLSYKMRTPENPQFVGALGPHCWRKDKHHELAIQIAAMGAWRGFYLCWQHKTA